MNLSNRQERFKPNDFGYFYPQPPETFLSTVTRNSVNHVIFFGNRCMKHNHYWETTYTICLEVVKNLYLQRYRKKWPQMG